MKTLFRMLAFTISIAAAGACAASEFGTAEEAVAMVKKAVAYMKSHDRDAAIEAVNKGQFVDRDLYVVIHDMKGKVLANPVIPRLVGKDLADVKDIDGKAFVRERFEILKSKDSGWNEFKWPNSLTQKVEARAVYFERAGDLVFACGILKK